MKNTYFNTNEELKNLTATGVVTKMHLDYDIQQKPVYCNNKRIPNTLANMRMDTEEVLGIVTERYTPVNNMDAFEWVDELAQDITITGAGELFGGRQSYLLADMGTRYITTLQQEVECKLAFTTNHDGFGSMRVKILPLINGNVINLPIKGTKRSFKAVHQKAIKTKMANAKNALDTARSYMDALMKETIRLSEVTFSDLQKDMFIQQLLPLDNTMGERGYQNLINRREELDKEIKGSTAFDFIMGVAAFIDNQTPQRKTKNGEINAFARILANDTLLDKAYKIIDNYIAR